MTSTRMTRSALLVLAALMGALLLGCEDPRPPKPSSHVVLIDVSKSATRTELMKTGVAIASERVKSMRAPGKVTVLAFVANSSVNSCDPLGIELPWSPNPTEISDAREDLVALAPTKITELLDCVLQKSDSVATDIFGSIIRGSRLIDSAAEIKTIDVVTDGCQTEGKIRTCQPWIADPDKLESNLNSLPVIARPHLDGVTVVMTGVGKGAKAGGKRDLTETEAEGLRIFWETYLEAFGAKGQVRA